MIGMITGIPAQLNGRRPAGLIEITIGITDVTAIMQSESRRHGSGLPHTILQQNMAASTENTRGIIEDLTSTYPEFLLFLNIWNKADERSRIINVA